MTCASNIPLAQHTTLKIGGPAVFFCRAARVEDIQEAVNKAHTRNLPLLCMGGGSNILVSDDGFSGLVLKIELRGMEFTDRDGETALVVASSGEGWDHVVEETVARGLWGLENLSGIPGTVGATPVQNVGAYGREVKDIIEWVEVFDTSSQTRKILSNEECHFSYRDSLFKYDEGKHFIITRVAFRLKRNGSPFLTYADLTRFFEERGNKSPTLSEIRRAVLAIRADKFPDIRTVGTAGSFFKNPLISRKEYESLLKRYPGLPGYPSPEGVKVSLAWILDRVCNLRGYREGPCGLFEHQPLVLINYGSASAGDVEKFARTIERLVKEATGIPIEREVTRVGF